MQSSESYWPKSLRSRESYWAEIRQDEEIFLKAYDRAKRLGLKDIAQNIVNGAGEHRAMQLDYLSHLTSG